jgi:hypothetical protein
MDGALIAGRLGLLEWTDPKPLSRIDQEILALATKSRGRSVMVPTVDPQHGLDGPLLAVQTAGKAFGGLHAHARMKPDRPQRRKATCREPAHLVHGDALQARVKHGVVRPARPGVGSSPFLRYMAKVSASAWRKTFQGP